jgi:hypothetical protein
LPLPCTASGKLDGGRAILQQDLQPFAALRRCLAADVLAVDHEQIERYEDEPAGVALDRFLKAW